MSHCKTLVVLGVMCLWVSRVDAVDPLGPCYGGSSDTYKYEVQASADSYGYYWYSDSVYLSGSAGQQFDISVRTRLGTYMSGIQAWSFGLEHDASELEYYGGSMELTSVTVQGTDTETVKSGYPPDFEATEVRAGYDGFTQGVIIDNNSQVTLGPVDGFVTAGACYRITMPYYASYCAVTLKFTHDIGDPPIDSAMVDDGESAYPCAKNLTIWLYQGSPAYTGCVTGGNWRSGSKSGDSSMKMPEELKALMEADLRSKVPVSTEDEAAPENGGDGGVEKAIGGPEEYVTQRITGALEPNDHCRHVRLSAGTETVPAGKFAVFSSKATNLGIPGTNGVFQIYRVEYLEGGGTGIQVVSRDENGLAASADCHRPSISNDGTKVVFDTTASLHSTLDTDDLSDVYIRDLAGANPVTRLLSYTKEQFVPLSEWGNPDNPWRSSRAESLFPSISGDGNYVAFSSQDATLDRDVAEGHAALTDLMVYRVSTIGVSAPIDPLAAETHIVSVVPGGVNPFAVPFADMSTGTPPSATDPLGQNSVPRVITDDGRFIVFFGQPTRLEWVPPDHARVYMREMPPGDPEVGFQVHMVPADVDGGGTVLDCDSPSISQKPVAGTIDYAVAFRSKVTTIGVENVYWNEFLDGAFFATTWELDLGAAEPLFQPNLSPDGRFIAFSSPDNTLVLPEEDNNNLDDIFFVELELDGGIFSGDFLEITRASVGGDPETGLIETEGGHSYNPDVIVVDSEENPGVRKVQVSFETGATNDLSGEAKEQFDVRDLYVRECPWQIPPSPEFKRGDADGDGNVNITDPIYVLNHLFAGGVAPGCLDAADTNDDGSENIADPVFLLNHLFAGGPAPSPPFQDCGVDPTPDDLSCEEATGDC